MSIPAFEFPPSFELLLQASWQGGLLVFVVLGMQRILRRQLTPAWRHALWWVVLGRLLIPATPPSSWSLFNLTPTAARQHILSPGSFSSSSGWRPVVATSAWGPSVEKFAPTSVFTVDRESTPLAVAPGTSPARSLGGAMMIVWGVGALVLLGRIGLQNLWFARRVRGLMRPADPDLLAMLDECRVRMGIQRRIDLLQGDAVSSPAVFGMLRPRILLPLSLARTCPPDQLWHILLHELAHIRRGDSLVHGLTRVLQALHWFNPVLTWAFRRLRADREIATDALALEVAGEQESRAYGLTIVELLQKWVAHPTQPNTVGILEDSTSLERRIRAIATYRRPSRWAPLASLVVAALAAVSWTSAQTDGSPKPASINPAVGTEPTKQLLKEATQQRESGNLDAARRKVESALELDPKKERQRIMALLESIRIPEVGFDRRPLEEVVRKLRDMARAHDPEGKGMNFFMNPYLDFVPGPDLGGGIDPEAGRTNQPASIEPPRLNDVLVRIDPPLRDVRMLDVLRALTLSASMPILFTVEEYAVVFAHKPPRHARLVTRVFRTNPERLSTGLESTHRMESTNPPPALKPVQSEGANPMTNPPAAGSNGNAPNQGATAERAGDSRSADSSGALATSDNAHAVLYAEKVLKVLAAESDQIKESASVEGGFKYCAQVEIVAMPLQSIPHVLRKGFESSARRDDPRILRTAVSAARSATRTDAKGNVRSWTNNPVFVRIWVGGNSTNDALRSARMSADQLAKRLESGKGTEADVVEVPHSVRPVTWRYDSLEPFLGRVFGRSR